LPDHSKFCSACGSIVATVAVTDPPIAGPRPSELQHRLIQALSGRYRIEKLLGQGGMGAVFLADDLELDRKVAIKVLPAAESNDSTLVERFRREARTAAKLDHPNIIPIYRVESAGNLHYFVMRYVPGKTLDDILADEPKLEIDRARLILVQAARALGHAHNREIVHRDVKPANIMLEDGHRVVLTDFGISKAVQATTNLTNTGMIIGTPSYMAPEQGRGQRVDGRADQYALGIVGYQILTGTLPFEADDVFALMFKQMSEPPPPITARRSDLPPGLARAIERALAKVPDHRFATMEEFARALESEPASTPTEIIDRNAAPRPRPLGGRPASTVRGPNRPTGRWRWPWLAGLSAIAAATALAIALPRGMSRQGGLGPSGESASPVARVAVTNPLPEVVSSRQSDSAPLTDSAPGLMRAPVPAAAAAPARSNLSSPPTPSPLPPPPPPPPAATQSARGAVTPSVVPAAPARVERALVTIGVDGSYATVYLDNELIGETPVVRELSFGEHDLRIEREGFKTIRQKLVVSGPTTRRFTLEPAGPP
jgi:serine/threonine-protein kinase